MSSVVMVTHQVATVSQQTLAVVAELREVAQQLDRATGQFQLSQAAPAEAAPPPLRPARVAPYDTAESC
jgi:hypothetical protein